MAKQEFKTIEILNWSRFNPRKDVKQSSWFRMSHSLLEDSDFFEFSHGEMIAWIYILSIASKKNSDTVTLNFAHAEHVARISRSTLLSAIEKLVSIQCVHVVDTWAVRGRDVDVTDTYATNERTNERTIVASLDFEAAYSRYPRKQGKSAGMKKLAREVKTLEDYEALLGAIDRYSKSETVRGGFIKLFSTFAGEWRDWTDPSAGTTKVVTAQNTQAYVENSWEVALGGAK